MTDELTNEFVAWNKANLDKEFTLFKLYTVPLRDLKTKEDGTFELTCRYDLAEFKSRSNPVPFLKHLVRKYVLHASQRTGVPVHRWIVEFSPIMEEYTIPSHLFLDTARDRAWLL
jgi:hypothetical protein